MSDADLKLMHGIDRLHMESPFAGSRILQGLLVREGFKVGLPHVATLMKHTGIEALYRRPNTSKPAPVKISDQITGNAHLQLRAAKLFTEHGQQVMPMLTKIGSAPEPAQ